jgi:hypothetical protein
MCLDLWTASSRARLLVGAFLVYESIWPGLCKAESLKGVVLSDQSGQGPHRVGIVRLAIGNKVLDLNYGEPIARHFRSDVCWEIGAVWSVTVQSLSDSSLDISAVRCSGQVDERANGAWRLVRDYLRLAGSQSTSANRLLSARWRSSREFREYETKVTNDLDLTAYRLHGRPGRCIEIVKLDRSDSAQLRAGADCYLGMELVFSVVRNMHNSKWEIDELKVE